MRTNVKVLPVLLIITCAACGQVPQPFQKTESQKVKDRELLAPANRSLFVKGINGPVGWVGNAFAKATADVLRRKGLLASSTWHRKKLKQLSVAMLICSKVRSVLNAEMHT